jgi:hypothetical protein
MASAIKNVRVSNTSSRLSLRALQGSGRLQQPMLLFNKLIRRALKPSEIFSKQACKHVQVKSEEHLIGFSLYFTDVILYLMRMPYLFFKYSILFLQGSSQCQAASLELTLQDYF